MRDGVFIRVFIFINRFMELLEMIKDNGDGTISIKAPCSFEKSTKKEALKLADRLEEYSKINFWIDCTHEQYSEDKYFKEQSAIIIRRLVEELDKQKEIDGVFDYYCDENIRSKQTKPLSDAEINESFDRTASHMANEYVSHYEPTAWINHIKQTGGDFYELNVSGRGEPLYRHPPQTKPLNDEEIYACFHQYFVLGEPKPTHYELDEEDLIEFARAIEERHGIK